MSKFTIEDKETTVERKPQQRFPLPRRRVENGNIDLEEKVLEKDEWDFLGTYDVCRWMFIQWEDISAIMNVIEKVYVS